MSDLLRDPLDFATQLSEGEREHNTKEIQRKAAPKQRKNADGTWPSPECEECGEDIGAERLDATGAVLCIECATLKEERNKQYAKR